MYRINQYKQTGDDASIVGNGSVIQFHFTSTSDGDYDSATLSYPGPGSPVAMFPSGPSFFIYVALFADQATMDAEFPFGTYSYEATGASGTDIATLDYTFDAYPASLPYLTGTDFTALQGMNP